MLLKDPRNQNPNVVSAFLQLPLVHQAAPRVYYQRLVRTSPFNMACYYTIHILQARLHTILGLHSVLRRGRVASKGCCLESVQDFLIKLDIKPLMHLLEISFFSLNNDLVRLAKIMNNLVKDLKILSFKVIFKCLKLVESFHKKISVKNI